jgi:hypothetical protein
VRLKECRRGRWIGKGKRKTSMLPLDGELLDAAEETGTVEKTINFFFGVVC